MRACALPALAFLLAAQPAVAAELVASPTDPRNFTWVEPGVLAVGGGGLSKGQVQTIEDLGFRAVASFRAEHKDPADAFAQRDIEHLYIPVDHAVDMNVSQLETFVAWAKKMEAEGRPVYAHCTNGWHRAAAFSAAWLMEREGLTMDQAFERLAPARPGTTNRAPSALLAYEAKLRGEPGLVVMLHAPAARPEPNATMTVEAEVLAHGRPAPGVKVKVWAEESGLRLWGETDERGRFAFTYKAPAAHAMDHLYARASKEGFVDGADNVELFYRMPIPTRHTLEVEARREGDTIHVKVLRDGAPVPARVLATTAEGWWDFDATRSGRTTLRVPEEAGAVTIRAEHWGDEGAALGLAAPRDRGTDPQPITYEPPEPARAHPPAPPPPPDERPSRLPLVAAVVAASAVVAAGGLALLVRRPARLH